VDQLGDDPVGEVDEAQDVSPAVDVERDVGGAEGLL
jgi:hypothetical protein